MICHLNIEKVLYHPFKYECLLFLFSSLIALGRTSISMLNRISLRQYTCCLPDLKKLVSPPLRWCEMCYFVDILYQFYEFPPVLSLTFCWILSSYFTFTDMSIWLFIIPLKLVFICKINVVFFGWNPLGHGA